MTGFVVQGHICWRFTLKKPIGMKKNALRPNMLGFFCILASICQYKLSIHFLSISLMTYIKGRLEVYNIIY